MSVSLRNSILTFLPSRDIKKETRVLLAANLSFAEATFILLYHFAVCTREYALATDSAQASPRSA